MRLWMLMPAQALAGCTSSVHQIVLPDQRAGFVVECEKLNACYKLATRSCPSGYEVVSTGRRSEGALVPTALGPVGSTTEYQNMVISCSVKP